MKTIPLKELGPQIWVLMHTFAGSYHSIHKETPFLDFINIIRHYLPCNICKLHFQKSLQLYKFNDYSRNNEDVLKWTYLLHNEVNKQKGVKSPSFETVRVFYSVEKDSRGYELNHTIWPVLFTFSQLLPRRDLLHFFDTLLQLMDPEVSSRYRRERYYFNNIEHPRILPWLYDMYRLHPENTLPFSVISKKYDNVHYYQSMKTCKV
jgi:hypothetical protein